ncbi:MAG: class I SAM-dependent methyltransferase [Dehalococcoidales bacterium]
MNNKNYFGLYEDRYRRLREQGIEDWISTLQELEHAIKSVDDFLIYSHCHPSKTSIIELGCGQGHLAAHLLGRGYRYLGVDISESAILQARKKAGVRGQNTFLLADITALHEIPDDSFDIAIDNQCFHMLIMDKHRKKYLAELKRVLKNGGRVFFRESYRPKEFKANIASLGDFTKINRCNYSTLLNYPAYVNGKMHNIKLPRIPARSNNEEGYKKELHEAGFTVVFFRVEDLACIMYATLDKKGKKE